MLNYQKLIVLFLFAFLSQMAIAQPAGNEMKRNPDAVQLRNTANINTSNLEFSPTFYQNGIVFASSRIAGKKDKKIDETFFELFYSETDGNGEPLKARAFSLQVNSFLHEGPVTFNRTGDKIFFTRNNIKKGLQKADSKGVTRLKIYEAQKGIYDWEDIEELPFNSDEFSCAHPTLSADGNKLYFSSDRPGGLGGMDVWMVEKTDDFWGQPINMGDKINTEGHDVFPFMHTSGNLFFASNGHGGKGGLDLFMANVMIEDTDVKNLGTPFNSESDDLGLILSPDGESGYFASNREGGVGKDDIYYFDAVDGIMGATTAELLTSTITIYDLRKSSLIEGAEIRVFEKSNEGFLSGDNNLYQAILLPAKEGSSEFIFKLIRKDVGSLGEADQVSDEKGEATYGFMGENEYLIVVTKEGYTAKETTYSTIGNESISNIRISLEKPTCATVSGIVRNKVTNQLLPNTIVKFWNGCTGEEEEIFSNDQAEYEYCAKPGCDYMIKGMKENYSGDFVKLPAAELTSANLRKDVLLTPTSDGPSIGAGTVIVLENIYYDFNKSAIRTGAARELDELVVMMQTYSSMMIELSSHTDSRGGGDYNLKLSQARAESAKQFLRSKGINGNRVRAVGYGESQPRNKCIDGVNCTEEDHQYNRRTEVKVTSIDSPVNIRYGNNAPDKIDRKN
jgi:outer membrane protein OmpA-like peptidoglycan-associated protein